MSYEFKRLADVPAVEELTDQDHLLAEVGGEVVKAPRREAGGALVVDLMEMEVMNSSNGAYALKAPDEATFSGLWKAVLNGRPICLRNFGELDGTNRPAPTALTETETANEETSEPGILAENTFVSYSLCETVRNNGALVGHIWLDVCSNALPTFHIYSHDYVYPGPQ